MNAKLFVEGAAHGANSKDLQVRCREGFRKLLEKCGLSGRMPAIVMSGSREMAFHDFRVAHAAYSSAKKSEQPYLALFIDSEDPIDDIEKTWKHLLQREKSWGKPKKARDEQVLLMTTCMETWIVADRDTLRAHFGAKLQPSALPALHELETRDRHALHDALEHATRKCANGYKKGKRSFEIVAKLQPEVLEQHLPSFARVLRILREKL